MLEFATWAITGAVGRTANAIYGATHAGSPRRYCIAAGYRHRDEPHFFDDTGNTENWQREVYQYAQNLLAGRGLRRVYDVGCGSGYKLVRYLGDFDTVGFDLPATVAFLREKYPERRWEVGDFAASVEAPDLAVCSDVIEHLPDPDALMTFLTRMKAPHVILSTPTRRLLYRRSSSFQFGPPANPSHCREWNFDEFAEYVSAYFTIVDHRITNREQGTQMIYCVRTAT
jgi:SAM-dependent methyltransferase